MNRNIILLITTIALWICSCVEPFNWIDRKDPIAQKLTPTGLRKYSIREEPMSEIAGRPPLTPCILSQTRTPFKPKGWLDCYSLIATSIKYHAKSYTIGSFISYSSP